jgi:uroporphyrinogen decarboxylase
MLKKATMTDRERIEALLRGEKPDRVPLWPFTSGGYAVKNAGYTISDAYNKPEKALEAQRWCCEQYGWIFAPTIGYAAHGGWEFGGEIRWPSEKLQHAPAVVKYVAETEDDVWKLEVPRLENAGIIPLLREFYTLSSKERLDNEPFNVKCFGAGAAFTTAGNIAGPEKLCTWMRTSPDVAHRLLRLATDYIKSYAQYWKGLFGIEGVLPTGAEPTSSNQLISPRHFEQFAMPYLKEVNEHFLDLGYKHLYVHICGEHNDNLPYWTQIPMGSPGFVSFGSEVELRKAASYFPRDIVVGNIAPDIFLNGTPQQVYDTTRKVIKEGKECPGGFVLSPGCELPPTAPPLNVWMMTKAVNDFGWYD